MTDGEFTGATQDPIGLLQQLLGHVAGLRRDMAQLRQDMDRRFDGLHAEVGGLRTEVVGVRADLQHFVSAFDRDQAARSTVVENLIERKTWLMAERLRDEWRSQHADVERRLAELEAAERQRKEGKGA